MQLTIQTTSHAYTILIRRGSLRTIGTWLQTLWQPQKVAIITDERVAGYYATQVKEQLEVAGFTPFLFAIVPGEQSKSLNQAARLYEELAAHGFTRSDGILALGGGVVGDLAGFVAATYMRGIHFVQAPTSLLAQVDSSIGGKTGVNTASAKNLVGTFSQPDGVLIDPDVLDTLDPRCIREGIAEVVKAAAIADANLWQELTIYRDEFDVITHAESVILQALQVKKQVVEEDEFDNSVRLLLNFGHTIGHAIEKSVGYGEVSHGEAVSLGMVAITQAAVQKKLTSPAVFEKLCTLLENFHLPIHKKTLKLDNETLVHAIMNDKKTRGSQIQLILLETIGQAKVLTIPTKEIGSFLADEEEI